MTRKRKAPEPTAEFDPHKPPLSACWWMQRFVDHFVADVTSKIERGDAHARVGIDCLLVGALHHACRLTQEQSDALLAVLNGDTPAEWAASLAESERRRGA